MTSIISSGRAAVIEAYVEQIRQETKQYQPWFTYLQWAEHMIAFGIVASIFGFSPIFIEFPWLRAICLSSGLILLLIGFTRYFVHWAKIIRANLTHSRQRP